MCFDFVWVFFTRLDNFWFFVTLDVYYTFFIAWIIIFSKCIHWFLCGFPFFLISVILCCHALLSLDSLVYEFGSISTQMKFTTQTEKEGEFCKWHSLLFQIHKLRVCFMVINLTSDLEKRWSEKLSSIVVFHYVFVDYFDFVKWLDTI